jgi:hypothetical protein
MTETGWLVCGWLLGTVLVAVGIRFAIKALRAAQRPMPRVSEAGLALVFLVSGRMAPPPPQSQIEAELDGEKDQLGSEPMSKPPDTSLDCNDER